MNKYKDKIYTKNDFPDLYKVLIEFFNKNDKKEYEFKLPDHKYILKKD